MEYIIVTLTAVSATTWIVYKGINRVTGVSVRLQPMVLCAACALLISLVLPRIVVGFAGLSGTLAFLFVFAIVFAYFVARYDKGIDNTEVEEEEEDVSVLPPVKSVLLPVFSVDEMPVTPAEQSPFLDEPALSNPEPVKVSEAPATIPAVDYEVDAQDLLKARQEVLQLLTVVEEVEAACRLLQSEPVTSDEAGLQAAAIDETIVSAAVTEPREQFVEPASTDWVPVAEEACPAPLTEETLSAADICELPEPDTQESERAEVAAAVSVAVVVPAENEPPEQSVAAYLSVSSLETACTVDAERPADEVATTTAEIDTSTTLLLSAANEAVAPLSAGENADVDDKPAEDAGVIATEVVPPEDSEQEPMLLLTTQAAVAHIADAAVCIADAAEPISEASESPLDSLLTIATAEPLVAAAADSVELLPESEPSETVVVPAADTESSVPPVEREMAVIADEPTQEEDIEDATMLNAKVGKMIQPKTAYEEVPTVEIDLGATMDELLDQAFAYKEEKRFGEALQVFRQALANFPDDSSAAFVVIEIGNLLKLRGAYDEAIQAFSEGRSLAALQQDPVMEQEFVSMIAYLRIVKNLLLQHRLGFIPYGSIPQQVHDDIDAEFRDWRKLI